MNIKSFFASAALLAVTSLPTFAAEHFVNQQGNDANDGTSRQAAFLTVKKGVDALQPGDTLTIGRGEYFESVTRDKLGSMDAQTTIRAEIPGTVVLRGDVDLPSLAFRKVDGYRFVYVADFDREVQAINEVDTLTQMQTFPTVEELEYTPGTCHYDAEAKKLYISTSDLQPPSTHRYTVSVIQNHGLMLTNPRRVTIDGIAARGFQSNRNMPSYPNHFTVWGIMAAGARDCIIRNCTAYFNGGGFGFDSSANRGADGVENGWNLIEKCTAYANGSKFAGEGGNLLGFASNHDEIRHSVSYRGVPNGIRFYGAGIRGPAIMKNNLSWGSSYADIFIKGGQADKFGLAERTISLGVFHARNLTNSLVGTINQYAPKPATDTVTGLYSAWGNQEVAKANRDRWFADPLNLDFRLQSTAPYRGAGPDGTDRGPFPYQANIFFVSAGGNDNNDGLSTSKPWKTLAHAMNRLRPGDTLYLEGGTYDAASELKIANPEGQSTSIRGRGSEPVIIRGDIAVTGSNGLELESLNFTGAITLADSRDIRFNNCSFAGQSTPLAATSVQNLKVTHCEFTGFDQAALRLDNSTLAWLSGNIFDNRSAPAVQTDSANSVLYSDYNSYANADNVWRVGGTALKLASLQEMQDEYSVVLAPQYFVEDGFPRLQNAHLFNADGPHGTAVGFYRAYNQKAMSVTPPLLHSVADTTADIEWWTSVPATTELAWGETPDTPNKVSFNKEISSVTDGFNTYSLSGLKPGTKYYFRLVSARPLDQQVSQYTKAATPGYEPLSFETAPAPLAARVLHVAPDGNNQNDGLSRERAFKTVAYAAEKARAGDTVQIAGGTYVETVRVRSSGTAERPLTFKSAPGEKVIFDGNRSAVVTAFSIAGKEHIRLDGIYFQWFGGGGWKSTIDIRQSKQIEVARCFFNGFGDSSFPVHVRAEQSNDVTLRNSVLSHGFQGSYFVACTDLRIENNVFMNNLICPILNSGGKNVQIRNNIFVDSIPSKVKVHLFEFGGFEQYVFDNNAFYLRIPDAERKPFLFYGSGPGQMSVGDFDKKTGYKNLIVDDPRFQITEGTEIVDRHGKNVVFLGDWIPSQLNIDFPDMFVAHPELKARKIGLLPEAFQGFYFQRAK